MGKAMLDPKRDLAGATPETLARALARPLLARRSRATLTRLCPRQSACLVSRHGSSRGVSFFRLYSSPLHQEPHAL